MMRHALAAAVGQAPGSASRTSATSLLPALAAWRRALHAPSEGRAAAAAAAAHPLPDDDDEEAAPAAAAAGAHARRLREQQQPQQPTRRHLDLSRVPMLDLKAAGGCAGASQPSSSSSSAAAAAAAAGGPPVRAAPPPLDWREVVRRARAARDGSASSSSADTLLKPLTDTHGRAHDYLRISLTERCNLRCTYCMPSEGVALTPSASLLTPAEVQRLARLFVRAGVTKIRLTGGEPTVRRDLADVVAALAELQEEGLEAIALTSNGVALERQLPRLRAAGLTHLNVSLDTLSAARFEKLTRRPADAHARVLGALDAALELGFGGTLSERGASAGGGGGGMGGGVGAFSSSAASTAAAAPAGVKLNVVVVRGVNDDEVEAFSALTRHAPLNVRFIEYMPFDGNAWGRGAGLVPFAELRGRADAYAARAEAEAAVAAMAAAALPFPLPPATGAWPLVGGGGGGWGGLAAASAAAVGGGGSGSLNGGGGGAGTIMGFATAAFHRLAGGQQQLMRHQQTQQQHRQRRTEAASAGPVARFAADVGADLPLVPPPRAPAAPAAAPAPGAGAAPAPLQALRRLDDHPSEVAKNFRAPGHRGTLSFVTSMTQHFCGGCSRLRLLADGALKVCLFGASEVSLRDAARGGASDDDLLAVVGAAVRRKQRSHAGMHEIARTSNRPMITIGG